jgi:hypothetical protein
MLIARKRVSQAPETPGSAKAGLGVRLWATGLLAGTLTLGGAMLTGPAVAQNNREGGISHAVGGSDTEQPLYVPFMDKTTGSYFQLVAADRPLTWEDARAEASRMMYKGRHGRLAIVRSIKTHLDLLRNLSTDLTRDAWIGLQYLCATRELAWSDSSPLKQGDFANWNYQWTQTDTSQCNGGYMGVTMSPRVDLKWLAQETNARASWYVVEYPAPKKAGKAASTESKSTTTEADASK